MTVDSLVLLREAWRVCRRAWVRRHLKGIPPLYRQVEASRVQFPAGMAEKPVRLTVPPEAAGWVIWPQSGQDLQASLLLHEFSRLGLATLQVPAAVGVNELEQRVERLLAATRWLRAQPEAAPGLPLSYLGLGPEAPAVLWAAAERRSEVSAVVAAGGRRDELDAGRLDGLWAACLLLAGRRDAGAVQWARQMAADLAVNVPWRVSLLPAGHSEAELTRRAAGWYLQWLLDEGRCPRRPSFLSRRRIPIRKWKRAASVGLATGSLVLTYVPIPVEAVPRSPAFAASSNNPYGLVDVGDRGKPAFADLDGDGDLDAFIGNFDGNTVFFKNTGTAVSPVFADSSLNPYGLAGVGSSAAPAFADLDGDGDLDAFVGNYAGRTIFFENTGTAVSPAFAGSSLNPYGLTDVGSFASPAFADLDGDGDLDAFVGNLDGNTVFFENTGSAVSPAFADSSLNPYGLAGVGSFAVPTFADLDGDGDLDAFIGEAAGYTFFFENTGRAVSPAFAASSPNPYGLGDVGGFASPAFADLDGDGDLDTFIGNSAGYTIFFENTGGATGPTFVSSSINPFGLTYVYAFAVPAFADLDGDGDLDAFIGDISGYTIYFENTGNATNPAFAASSENPFGLTSVDSFAAPVFADLDGDGDLDAFIGEEYGYTIYFENTGSATNPAFAAGTENPFGLTGVGYDSAPTFADLDGDGDLDAFIGNYVGYTIYFENTGTATSPAFAGSVLNPFGLGNVYDYAIPTFADLDGDGDLDAFVGNCSYGETVFFENTGSATNPVFASSSANPYGLSSFYLCAAPTFVDINGDGDLDAFVGNYYGDTIFFRNGASPTAVTVRDLETGESFFPAFLRRLVPWLR